MQDSKFSFSIKKPSGKSSHVTKSNTVFMSHENDSQSVTKSTNSGTSNREELTPKKTTQITSFSNSQSKLERQGGNDDDHDHDHDSRDGPIIECKNPLSSSKAINNIEILLKKKNEYKQVAEDHIDLSNSSNGFSIPVSKFGLAMLRGMGYNPEIHNTKPKIFKKRNYNQSGLGADKEFGNIPKR